MKHEPAYILLRRTLLLIWLISVAGCSTALYQASGEYIDSESRSREILLQWKAQKYYIPFVETDVDYGSISLQAECMEDVLMDHRNEEELGLVFVERPQEFRLAPGAPNYRLGNYRVCAMFEGSPSIELIIKSDQVDLLILCESKHNVPFIAATEGGYPLSISEGEEERTLLCRP